MKHEKMLADLKHYTILEKEMQKQGSSQGGNSEYSIEFEELTQENIKFCAEALELFTLEEKWFFRKVAVPFGGKITVLKDKLNTTVWEAHLSIDCTYMEGEGLTALEEKGKIKVDFIVKSNESFKPIHDTLLHYMAYDKDEEVFGFIVEKEGNEAFIYFTADCENVTVIYGEVK